MVSLEKIKNRKINPDKMIGIKKVNILLVLIKFRIQAG